MSCATRMQEERREYQATIDALTADNHQLRLDLSRLQADCARCARCAHHLTTHRPLQQVAAYTINKHGKPFGGRPHRRATRFIANALVRRCRWAGEGCAAPAAYEYKQCPLKFLLTSRGDVDSHGSLCPCASLQPKQSGVRFSRFCAAVI